MGSTKHDAFLVPSLAVQCYASYLNSVLNFFKIPTSLYVKRV